MLKKRTDELDSRGNANQVETRLDTKISGLEEHLAGVERRIKSV